MWSLRYVHEDHVAGLLGYLEWCKRNKHHIRLLVEPGIYEHLKHQMKLALNDDPDTVYDIEYIPLRFYQSIVLGKRKKCS